MGTSIAAVADRAWLTKIAAAASNEDSPLDEEERVNRWADAVATSAARSIAHVLPRSVVSSFTAQLGDFLATIPEWRAVIEAAAADLPAPSRAPQDHDSDRELEHNLHLLVAVASGTTAVNDFLFMLMRILRQRPPGLVALGFGAAAAFFTAAATSSARLAGVDHERSVEAFRGARGLLEEQLTELAEEQRAIIARVSMALHTYPRDARTNDLPRVVAADHVMAMLALGEVLMRGPGNPAKGG